MSTSSVQKLNNWLQQAGRSTQVNWDDQHDGPTHATVWTSTVQVEGRAMGTGTGPKKSLARDKAAQQALEVLHAEYVAAGGKTIEEEP